MSGFDALRGVPQHVIERERHTAYPTAANVYEPLMGFKFQGDLSNLPLGAARSLPLEMAALLKAETDGGTYTVQYARAESIAYADSIRFLSEENRAYRLQANVCNFYPIYNTFREMQMPVTGALSAGSKIICFELKTKINGEHYPPFKAAKFLPWALRFFNEHKPTHLLAFWEPAS